MSLATALTIEDYEKLPDALALHHELVDGELVDVSGNTAQHNRLRDLIVRLLAPIAEERMLGLVIGEQEFDFGGNAHGPDVAFISASKVHLIRQNLRVQRFVPDLAIEIASQNDKFESLARKAKRYRDCGTAEVWIFSLATRQAMHFSDRRRVILDETDDFAPEQLPGFSIRLGELLDRVR